MKFIPVYSAPRRPSALNKWIPRLIIAASVVLAAASLWWTWQGPVWMSKQANDDRIRSVVRGMVRPECRFKEAP